MTTGLPLEERARVRGVDVMIAEICLLRGISVSEFYGRSRRQHVVRARHAVYMALRERGFSYPEIAWIAGKDHTGVMYGVAKAVGQ